MTDSSSTLTDTQSTPEERDKTFRRVMFRILPFALLIYIVAWLDRTNVSFAKLTMMDELSWSEAVYGAGAGIFFLGYFLFEVPSNLLLQRIGAPKTLTRIGLGWGLVTLLMAFVTEPWHFYVLRFLQGAFEAGLHPGLILYVTFWLPTHRRAKAIAVLMSASPIAQLIGGPLAGYIMTSTHGAMNASGWQWLFLIEGVPAIILGALTLVFMTDRPGNAKWLSDTEKEHIRYELEADEQQAGPRQHSFTAALRNPTMWLLTLTLFCILWGNNAISFFGPSLVKATTNLDVTTIGWIMSGVFAFGWFGMLFNGWLADRDGHVHRCIAVAVTIGATGLTLAAVALQLGSSVGVVVALAMSAAGTMGSIPVFWSLPSRFITGTALAGGIALINSIANLAGFFAPQLLGYIKTATGTYTTGLYIIAAVELVAALTVVVFIKRKVTL
ncbi:MFS transporter [Mycobacterium sp. 236(2023)]|uniref:MFS transporter n=1 Tax=Mycobacterium sp. 236(2023) TaxID=3038163 RepID=UPI00241508CC|nr:MFS transporter [Mycobacterium sp. 236(2023)]MDG4667191.1 MFS transporter [Mycobacterium sp. 236(2023)]